MHQVDGQPPALRRELSLFDTVAIMVGIVIGAGFYQSTPLVASNVPSATFLIGLWIFGGIVALLGAICYAELAAAFPAEGGEYVFLTRAMGRRVGFLFAWTAFWIVRPGNIGVMAFVFARYAHELLGLGRYDGLIYSAGSVVVLSMTNLLGIQSGRWTQNLLSSAKLLGLVGLFIVGLISTPAPRPASGLTSTPEGWAALATAMTFVFFTYGGWNDMSYVAAEVREPRKNILRSLMLGTLIVTVIYVVGNLVFLKTLGFEGLRQSSAPAADVLRLTFASAGAKAISGLICISCLGAINGMILTGSRIYYALGTEHRVFGWLGQWNQKRGAPVRSLVVQGVVTTALVLAFGAYPDGFDRMVMFTAPVFFLFFMLTGVSLFALRHSAASVERPYRVTGYPLTPALFILACGFMFCSTTMYAMMYAIKNRTWEGMYTVAMCVAALCVMVWERGKVEA